MCVTDLLPKRKVDPEAVVAEDDGGLRGDAPSLPRRADNNGGMAATSGGPPPPPAWNGDAVK